MVLPCDQYLKRFPAYLQQVTWRATASMSRYDQALYLLPFDHPPLHVRVAGAGDQQARPLLMKQAIRALQDVGVAPDVWKVKGLARRDDCARIVYTARPAPIALPE